MLGTVDHDGLAALRADPEVVQVVGAPALSPIRPRAVRAAKLSSAYTWGLERLGAPALWERGLTGKGVLVGQLDTGIDGEHPTLQGAVAHFAEFDLMGREVTPPPKPKDSDEHGTHTAATIVGRAAGGRHVGMAPGAKLASAAVIEGGDAVARVLGGMDWALGKGVRVLSLSLGFRGYWPDFLAVTRILRRKGVLPVFAVGNEYAGSSRSPGNYSEALSVGACDKKGHGRRLLLQPALRAQGRPDRPRPRGSRCRHRVRQARRRLPVDGRDVDGDPARGRPRGTAAGGEAEGEREPARSGALRLLLASAGHVARAGRQGHPGRREGPRGPVTTTRRSKVKVDPELRRQLDQAAASKPAPVQAVLRLRQPTRRSKHPPEPEAAQDVARDLLARVAEEIGAAASDYDFNVFPNLGYLVLSASAGFVERVLDQPEIASASANRRG